VGPSRHASPPPRNTETARWHTHICTTVATQILRRTGSAKHPTPQSRKPRVPHFLYESDGNPARASVESAHAHTWALDQIPPRKNTKATHEARKRASNSKLIKRHNRTGCDPVLLVRCAVYFRCHQPRTSRELVSTSIHGCSWTPQFTPKPRATSHCSRTSKALQGWTGCKDRTSYVLVESKAFNHLYLCSGVVVGRPPDVQEHAQKTNLLSKLKLVLLRTIANSSSGRRTTPDLEMTQKSPLTLR
jgi:hypothetical protein